MEGNIENKGRGMRRTGEKPRWGKETEKQGKRKQGKQKKEDALMLNAESFD